MPHPKGGYRNKAGKKVPSVTTITNRFKDSGGLLWWAFEQGKAAERGEIESLYDKRDEAAEAGKLAHALAEAYLKGKKLPDIPDDKIGEQARQGFKNFIRWFSMSKLEVAYTEVELVSEEYQYGGCNDLVFQSDLGLAIGDIKTSGGIYVGYLVQIAAYAHLWNEKHPEAPLTGGFHLCRFSKEDADFAHHFWTDLSDAWEMFKLLRKAYDLDKKLKKRI